MFDSNDETSSSPSYTLSSDEACLETHLLNVNLRIDNALWHG